MSVSPWDPYRPDCPSRRLLDRIGDRWAVLIVNALDPGPQRFTSLAAAVGGISQKMLTQNLRALERDGFVTRTVYPEIPPRVEYELTVLGRSLLEPLRALEHWALANMDAVWANQQAYDASSSRAPLSAAGGSGRSP